MALARWVPESSIPEAIVSLRGFIRNEFLFYVSVPCTVNGLGALPVEALRNLFNFIPAGSMFKSVARASRQLRHEVEASGVPCFIHIDEADCLHNGTKSLVALGQVSLLSRLSVPADRISQLDFSKLMKKVPDKPQAFSVCLKVARVCVGEVEHQYMCRHVEQLSLEYVDGGCLQYVHFLSLWDTFPNLRLLEMKNISNIISQCLLHKFKHCFMHIPLIELTLDNCHYCVGQSTSAFDFSWSGSYFPTTLKMLKLVNMRLRFDGERFLKYLTRLQSIKVYWDHLAESQWNPIQHDGQVLELFEECPDLVTVSILGMHDSTYQELVRRMQNRARERGPSPA